MRILVIEDDEFTAEALKIVLSDQHYAVEVAKDGQTGRKLVEAFAYDLILLDVILPKLDGISLCRQLRSQGYQMPILLLTGRDSTHDKAIGLDAGADDYLIKPFEREELLARVRALLRRGSSTSTPILEWGSLQLDPSSCEVTYKTQLIHLTPKEYSLLELFLRNSSRVFSCSAILDRIWSFDKTPGEEAVRTQIKGLRQKLKSAGAPPDLIETVYGIGYRLKPIQAIALGTASPDGEHTAGQMFLELACVWEQYQERISEQIALIERAAAKLLQKSLSAQLQARAQQEAHTLGGSLGTFGFPEGSRLAKKIERIFQAKNSLAQNDAIHLFELVEALREQIKLPPQELTTAKTNQDQRPFLLIVDRHSQLTEKLVIEASVWGIRAEVATNLLAARDIITYKHPNVVLLDLNFSHTTEQGLMLLAELGNRTPPMPVLVYTDEDNLTTRLEVARAGGHAFLQKPAAPATVLQAVNQMLQHADPTVAKVMVVDDDPQILATLRTELSPWGLLVITLSDPLRFWETLTASEPDLLILDINMPHVSGIELCQVVRNDVRWSGLPVLFLTAYTDATIVNQVFAAGADDFVSKPIIKPELVTRIINRLERIKLLRNLAQIDPLTGVDNRYKSTQDLDKFLCLSQRHNQPLCLSIIDLDHFKLVNDAFGHTTGDTVLRHLGQMLRRSFRNEDVVARWGGEEFVLGMYGMTKSDGVQRLTEVLDTLRQQKFIAPNNSQFQITFSAGVAQYPEDGFDLESLYKSADAALYQAKAAGRDLVLPAENKSIPPAQLNSLATS